MQIIGMGRLIVSSCLSFRIKKTDTRRWLSLIGRPPDIKTIVRLIPAETRLPEPFMLIACVVDHHVHDKTKSLPVTVLDQLIQMGHSPIFRLDSPEIADII